MPSFYCPDFTEGISEYVLSLEESHHLINVMRVRAGDSIKLNSGKGWLGKGNIFSIERKKVYVQVVEADFKLKPTPSFAIAFSLLRNKNDDWLVEKTTELGVSDLFPLNMVNSVRTQSANTVSRFKASALSAIKQCDNPWLPEIHPVLKLDVALELIKQNGYTPIATSELRPDNWINCLSANVSYCFIIGPEGGFDPSEFAILERNRIESISISDNILRAETAAVAVAAQFNLFRQSNGKLSL